MLKWKTIGLLVLELIHDIAEKDGFRAVTLYIW